jgi:hypothetical protein
VTSATSQVADAGTVAVTDETLLPVTVAVTGCDAGRPRDLGARNVAVLVDSVKDPGGGGGGGEPPLLLLPPPPPPHAASRRQADTYSAWRLGNMPAPDVAGLMTDFSAAAPIVGGALDRDNNAIFSVTSPRTVTPRSP